ncbi:PIG-L family deacetylase [Membranihabitans marinus]
MTFLVSVSSAQNKVASAAEIYSKLEKLGNLGSVLYIAAHPDDENTNLISYFNNAKNYHTTYLSLTRGDGGQNLIGPELREQLGVIRTQELLAARSVDGGFQRFSRANDFGYSKSPDETFELWNKDSVMYDIIWTIRMLKPDIIVNRFDHRTPGTTHGHHTGSAMLSFEAFEMAGDPSVFPEQLKYVDVWQPSRLFFNTSWWFYGSQEKFEQANKENLVGINVGEYYPLMGQSNNEISARSRSQHRCQGFGRIGERGSSMEYLEFIKGDRPKNPDAFDGINTTWERIPGGKAINDQWQSILENYDFKSPSASVPALLTLYQSIQQLPESSYKNQKITECQDIIESCMGLFLEIRSNDHTLVRGQNTTLDMEVINRSNIKASIDEIEILPTGTKVEINEDLENNQKILHKIQTIIPSNAGYTSPYWLNDKSTIGMYSVANKTLIGKPETPRYLRTKFHLKIMSVDFVVEKDVVYKTGLPERGEVYKPLEIVPKYTLKIDQPILFFKDESSQILNVDLSMQNGEVNADTLKLNLGNGFESKPGYYLLQPGKTRYSFEIKPLIEEGRHEISAEILGVDGQIYDQQLTTIQYDHIPEQTILTKASSTLVKLKITHEVDKIAYIQGAGDKIPEFLRAIGIQCDELIITEISNMDLNSYDAIVLGIRALNTIDEIEGIMPYLLQYTQDGGNLIVQYNTNRGLKIKDFAPYSLQLSRDRVTNENSPVRLINTNHPALNTPNQITSKDFEGWVQERGLYFPNQWAAEYKTIVSFQDPGEEFLEGGILIAPYGHGNYIYTGLSWFRELPAGVTGAYKLFINLLSLQTNN